MNGAVPEMGGEVVLIADELSRAVELALNPAVAHESRNQAYNACESFKENSPWCAQAGLLLASGAQYSAVVKHFGLQLMEHTVKYRWTQITQAEKIFIKENAMKLLYLGGWETGHLNDVLARVIVEMIKREWPQQWPTLLAELSDACSRGHMHTEIVLHVFLRLVEDVATLQTLEQNQRRKDIYQALTSNMAEIFAFFMRLAELHVQEFREKTAAGDYAGAASNGRVVQVVLLTLSGFVEWVSTSHIVANNGRLLQMLCILLQDASFQLAAAECLLQLVHRKGSTKERKPLLILFSEDAFTCIHRAALDSINKPDEEHYLFLKKLSQVLAGLAQQLTTLWSHVTNADSWLVIFLETVLLLTSHPSLTIVHSVNSVWLVMLKHEQMCKLPQVVAALPRWLTAAAPKLLKVSYASRTNEVNDAVTYACIDYDSEQEFAIFFSRFRTELLDSFRYCMSAGPLVTWSFAERWAQSALDQLHRRDPAELQVEWEALAQVLDVILSRLLTCSPRPSVSSGLSLLSRVTSCEPAAASLRSLLLSLLSALFVFLSCASSQLAGPNVSVAGVDLLPRVLDKIFSALVYEGTPPEDRRSRSVKNVRRHAASLLVKLGSKYPLLLLPVFNRLHDMCRSVVSRADMSAVESVTVQEALLLVSNQLCCYQRQTELVAQVLGDCSSRWQALSVHISSAPGLARLIGLDSPAINNDDINDEHGVARRTLLHALTLLLGVVKRTQIPGDPDKASRGGFSAGLTPAGNPLWRNPCTPHVLPLFPHALALCRSLHDLHTPEAVTLRHGDHAKALQPPVSERKNLLGLRDHDATASTPQDRMQNFIHTLHDNVCHLIGAAASTLGRELYSAPGVGKLLSDCLFPHTHLPDHWLRRIVRVALKPIIAHCPAAHVMNVNVPILEHAAPPLLVHLSARWDYVTSLYESGKLEEEAGAESQEVLDDMLVRHLTREYLELLKVALVDVGVVTESSNCDMEEDSPPPLSQARIPEQVSELGGILMAHPATGQPLLHTILRALTWNDSPSSLRACALSLPALRASLAAGGVTSHEAAGAIACILQALRTHGQHDANQAALLALAVQAYESLRPLFPGIVSVLRAIPDVDAHDLHRLDEKIAANTNKPHKIDKTKRDLFKKITSRLIGRDVGQLFKKEVYILDLPSMPVAAKDKPRSILETNEGAHLENIFANKSPT